MDGTSTWGKSRRAGFTSFPPRGPQAQRRRRRQKIEVLCMFMGFPFRGMGTKLRNFC